MPFVTAEPPLPEPLRSFDSTAAALAAELAGAEKLAAEVRDLRLSGRLLANTLESIRVELTYHSNAIEGNTLSLRETQLIIEGKSPGAERDLREIEEARNHDRALRQIEKWARDRPTSPLDLSALLDLHRTVLTDIDSAAGRFRSDRVRIVGTGFVPPGSHKFDALLPQLVDRAHRPQVHPVLQAAELHYNLAAVHPFADGNGRTARLLMNHHLLRRDFPYAVIELGERGLYLAALDHANLGRVEPFARLVLDAVVRTSLKLLGQ
ncbi:MAG TPA: Fic family protein [Tepidisphaeraceae bacterium]|nr:Fic family protein [Tepidisphaeraceae bacterium]